LADDVIKEVAGVAEGFGGIGVEALGEEFDNDRVEVFAASISEGLELGLEFGWEGDGHREDVMCGRCSYFSGFTMVCDQPSAIVCGCNGSGLARVEKV
jgi:hypothetical protein